MPPHTVKILIVEDERAIARDISESLTSLGYVVVGTASSGESAIQQISDSHPDLVLMDIFLSDELDGIATAQQIWQQFQTPVVYLTAHADEMTLQRAQATMPFGYIVKPFNDATLKVTIETALNQYKIQLNLQNQTQEANQRTQTYAAMAAHEFRNLLGMIQMSADMLQIEILGLTDQPKDQQSQERMLKLIQSSASNINAIVEDVLLLMRSGNSHYPLNWVKVELVSFCQHVVSGLSLLESDKNRIVLLSPQGEITATTDEKLLISILNNLLSNALKYSPPDNKVALILSVDHTTYKIQVKDRGIGIPAEYLSYLFKPFKRADNVGDIPGTGIGLAIVKQFAELLRGDITVESVVGLGTTFTVTMPLD